MVTVFLAVLSMVVVVVVMLTYCLTGMVCIVSSLVDGQGNPVTVLAGPQPSRHSACDRIFSDDYPKLVTATVYDSASCKAGPGLGIEKFIPLAHFFLSFYVYAYI